MALVQAERLSASVGAIAHTEARTASAFAAARRHSRLVKLLRVLLPVGSLAAIGVVGALTLLRTFAPHLDGLTVGETSIDGTKITMGKPRLMGARPDGSSYLINAERAIQDITHPTDIELFKIDGDIGQRDQLPMKLTASAGQYNSASEKLHLSGVVRLKNSSYTVDMKSADVDFKSGVYVTRDPIDVVTAKGMTVEADSATAEDNATRLSFAGHVKTEIPPQASDEQPRAATREPAAMKAVSFAILVCLAATAPVSAALKSAPSPSPSASPDAGLFPGGNSKDPIFIEADRLNYSDKDSKAIYTGNVVLIQGPTKLTCTVMTLYIDKTPTATPSATPLATPAPAVASPAAGPSSSSSQVKHMDCTGPVTVLSKTQTATGDNAVYDKPQNKVWLLGHVTLSDGPNVTKGDKLTYDLLTGHAIVETNAASGKGRVQSQFIPNSNDNSSPTPSPSPAKP